MKIGEIYTTDRPVHAGTGYTYAPVLLTGGVALLGSEMIVMEPNISGGVVIQRFHFQFLRPGNSAIQFAYFRSFDLSDAIYENVLPFTVDEHDNGIVPIWWSKFETPSQEDLAIFNSVMEKLVGVDYTPKMVSKRTLVGTSYRFFCDAVSLTLPPMKYPAIVEIWTPFASVEDAKLVDIKKVLL